MDIELRNISKSYQNNIQAPIRVVLQNVNLWLPSGTTAALMGPSGSGKTTLLNILGTMDQQFQGDALWDGKSIRSMSNAEILALRNKAIGFVFQYHYLLPQCTLLENVLLPTLTDKESKKKAAKRAEELLQRMGVWEYRHQKPDHVSGGECQRTAIARALIQQPRLLLADEPTGSLDQNNADNVLQLLLSLHAEMNITLVLATHEPSIAKQMHKIFFLHDMKLNESLHSQ